MPKKKPRETDEPTTLQEAIAFFADEDRALDYFSERRWPNGEPVCPYCGSAAVLFLKNQRRWKCGTDHAKRQFSIKVGTVMEDSPLPLGKWLMAMWMVANCKNGVSSYEIHRAIGVTQKSAWFMLQRIRLAMQSAQGGGKLGGTVEVDETFIGGKARNMHKHVRDRKVPRHAGHSGKAIVVGLLDRHSGKVRAKQIPNTKYLTLSAEIREHVRPGSKLYTDQNPSYRDIELDYEHRAVNHAAEEYVRGAVHTNGIENFWSLLKRSIRGTYVSVEPFHLFRYVDEQVFRFNERKDEEGDRGRLKTLTSFVGGQHLTYKELIAQAEPSAAAPA
jgi:transposase-like protein